MNEVQIVLRWADQVGLSLQYGQLRPNLLAGIHAGYQASLPRFVRDGDQLWSDLMTFHRQGPLVDGVLPYRRWLENAVFWAERTGQSIESLAPILVNMGLGPERPVQPPLLPDATGSSKLEVLFLSANPDRARLLNIDREVNEIQTLVESTTERDRFSLNTWPDIHFAQIAHRLLRLKPRVLHFSGHGARTGELLMIGEDGKELRVPPKALADLLEVVGGPVRLVVLNACYSDVLAQQIVTRLNVAVVGMTRMVADTAALLYARTLYQGLMDGLTPRAAHQVAKATLVGMNQPGAESPILRTRDGSDIADMKLWD